MNGISPYPSFTPYSVDLCFLKKKKKIFFFGPVARGIVVSWPDIKPASPALQGRFLAIGLPGKSSLPRLVWMISNPLINYDTGSSFIIV